MFKSKSVISLFLVIVMIANVVIGGIMLPKKAEALCFSDFIGGPANIISAIKDGAKWVWEKAENAWDKAKTIVSTHANTSSAISNAISAAKDLWEKAEEIFEIVVKYIWAATRKRLLNMLVNNIIQWIQGGESPRFVTDWKKFLQDAAGEGIGAFIEGSELAFLCNNFKVELKIALGTVPPFQRQVGCTLGDIEDNISNFYDDITKGGGWDGWLTVTESNNNFQGVYWGALGEKLQRAAQGKEAAANDAKSSGGFLSQKMCVKWDCPDGGYEECMSWPNSSEEKCHRAACTCAKEEIVTPGQTLASAASKAVNLDIDWLISAKEFEEYAAAILDAVVNRVAREGLSKMKTNKRGDEYKRQNVTKESAMFLCKASSGQACMCLDDRNPEGACRVDSKGRPIISFEQWEGDMERMVADAATNMDGQANTDYYNPSQSSSDTKELLMEFKLMLEKLQWQLMDALPYIQEEYETSEAMKFCAEYKYNECVRVAPDRTLRFVQNDETCGARCMAYVQSFFQCDTVPPLIPDPNAPMIPDPKWPTDSEKPAPLIHDPNVLIPDPKFVSQKCLCQNRQSLSGVCEFNNKKPIVTIDQIPDNYLQTMLNECYQPIADELEDTFKQECDKDILRDKNTASGYFDYLGSQAKLTQTLDIISNFRIDKSIAEDLLYRSSFHQPFEDCVEGACSSAINFDLCEKNVLSQNGVCKNQLTACQQGESIECQKQFEKCDPNTLVEGTTCQKQFDACKEISCQSQFDQCQNIVTSEIGMCYEQKVKIDEFVEREEYKELEKCVVDHCVTEGINPPPPPNAVCRANVTSPAKEAVMAGGTIISPATEEGFCYDKQFVTVNYDEVMNDEQYIIDTEREALLKIILNNKMPTYNSLSGTLEFNLQATPVDGDKCFNGEEMPTVNVNKKANGYEKEHFCITREMNKCASVPWFDRYKLKWTITEQEYAGATIFTLNKEKDIVTQDYMKEHFTSNSAIIQKAANKDLGCKKIGSITEKNSCDNCQNYFWYCDMNVNGEVQEDGTTITGWVDWWGNPVNSGGVQIWNMLGGEWDHLFDIEVPINYLESIFQRIDAE